MAPNKLKLLAIAVVIVILSGVALGFALTKLQPSRTVESNVPENLSETSPSPITPIPTATNSPSPVPTQTPTSTPAPTKTGNESLELTLSLEKTVYNVGEPVNVTLTITNVSDQTVSFTHTGMDFNFLVYNDSNSIIYIWSIGKAFPQFVTLISLKPGENVTATYVWPQTSNISTSTEATQVPPGTYFIVGESSPTYGFQTAPVQVTIIQ
ncbi:MAG: BsuPI-related putative proteinase inhibitor [Candidatus Bathyarchaeia archaeon]|jgi:hypothetical protein